MCDRHGSKLLNGKVSGLPDLLLAGRHPSDNDGHGNVGYVPMAITGYLEQSKLAAQRTRVEEDPALLAVSAHLMMIARR